MNKVKRIAVSLPTELENEFEDIIRRKAYLSRSKAVADAIHEYISNAKLQESHIKTIADNKAVGITIILYNHHTRGVTDKLTEIQHEFGSLILSSLHVHLDNDNCLEAIATKGDVKAIEKLANSLMITRGVKQGKLVVFQSL